MNRAGKHRHQAVRCTQIHSLLAHDQVLHLAPPVCCGGAPGLQEHILTSCDTSGTGVQGKEETKVHWGDHQHGYSGVECCPHHAKEVVEGNPMA